MLIETQMSSTICLAINDASAIDRLTDCHMKWYIVSSFSYFFWIQCRNTALLLLTDCTNTNRQSERQIVRDSVDGNSFHKPKTIHVYFRFFHQWCVGLILYLILIYVFPNTASQLSHYRIITNMFRIGKKTRKGWKKTVNTHFFFFSLLLFFFSQAFENCVLLPPKQQPG